MLEMHSVLTILAVLAPIFAAVLAAKQESARGISIVAVSISLLAIATAVWFTSYVPGLLSLDKLATAPALTVSAVVLGLFLMAPKRDVSGRDCAGVLVSFAGALAVYCADDPIVMFAGFLGGAFPFLKRRQEYKPAVRLYAQPRLVLGLSVLLFGGAIVVRTLFGAEGNLSIAAFILLTVAALMRNGIFPFHSWFVTAGEEANPMQFATLVSGQTGAFLIVRLALPLYPEAAQMALPIISQVALIGTLFTAFLALGERTPRRILALLTASQSGFIISGLESRNIEGVTGALSHWIVVAVSATGVLMALRCMEARCGELTLQSFAGLGARAPRIATCFLIFGMALVGLPGTLGFCAEDLLFHGALEAHPFLGVALPLATALSAFQLLRLFSWVFLGRNSTQVPMMSDALPRERLAFTCIALFLIISGLAPKPLISSRVGPAEQVVSYLTASGAPHPRAVDTAQRR